MTNDRTESRRARSAHSAVSAFSYALAGMIFPRHSPNPIRR